MRGTAQIIMGYIKQTLVLLTTLNNSDLFFLVKFYYITYILREKNYN